MLLKRFASIGPDLDAMMNWSRDSSYRKNEKRGELAQEDSWASSVSRTALRGARHGGDFALEQDYSGGEAGVGIFLLVARA